LKNGFTDRRTNGQPDFIMPPAPTGNESTETAPMP